MKEEDLHAKLSGIINEALAKIERCSPDELGVLHQTAYTIRGQAIGAKEAKLQAEAERLMYAVEDEIHRRGGDEWLEEQAAKSMDDLNETDIRRMASSEIMQQLNTCHSFAEVTTSPIFGGSCSRLIDRLNRELEARGQKAEIQKVELPKGFKKFKVPSVDDIINGKSASDIPNN